MRQFSALSLVALTLLTTIGCNKKKESTIDSALSQSPAHGLTAPGLTGASPSPSPAISMPPGMGTADTTTMGSVPAEPKVATPKKRFSKKMRKNKGKRFAKRKKNRKAKRVARRNRRGRRARA